MIATYPGGAISLLVQKLPEVRATLVAPQEGCLVHGDVLAGLEGVPRHEALPCPECFGSDDLRLTMFQIAAKYPGLSRLQGVFARRSKTLCRYAVHWQTDEGCTGSSMCWCLRSVP